MTIISLINRKLVVALIGLPARGKSYVSKKLTKYFNWLNINCEIFNVGNYRRRFEGQYGGNNFFDSQNNSAQEIRKLSAETAMKEMIHWLEKSNGEIAFFDATNTTRERREWIKENLRRHNLDLLYLEIVCDDEDTINENIVKVKLHTADYVGCAADKAIEDFKTRISHYESVYEPVDREFDSETSFIQIINKGDRLETNKLDTVYKTEIFKFVGSIRLTNRFLKICIDLPEQINKQMQHKSRQFLHLELDENNEIQFFSRGHFLNDVEQTRNLRSLCVSKTDINTMAVKLIPIIIESEVHNNLTISCNEMISKELLRYFNSESINKCWTDCSKPSLIKVICNPNKPSYETQLIM